jgi:hypothetical protein
MKTLNTHGVEALHHLGGQVMQCRLAIPLWNGIHEVWREACTY